MNQQNKIYTYFIQGENGAYSKFIRKILDEFLETSFLGTSFLGTSFLGTSFLEIKKYEELKQIGYVDLLLKLNTLLELRFPKLYDIQSFLKINNILIDKINLIDLKRNLFYNLYDLDPKFATKYIPLSIIYSNKLYDIIKNNFKDQPLIMKPEYYNSNKIIGKGKGIEIVTNKQNLKSKAEFMKKIYGQYPLISVYLTDPLLIENKKFHLRIAWLIRKEGYSISGKYVPNHHSTLNIGHIRTSSKNYNKHIFDKNWKELHDTHNDTSDRNRYLSYNISQFEKITYRDTHFNKLERKKMFEDVNKITSKLYEIMKNKYEIYSDSKNSFCIFGLDIMFIKNNNKIVGKLIEVNGTHSGFDGKKFYDMKHLSEKERNKMILHQEMFSEIFWNWAFENGIKPFFE